MKEFTGAGKDPVNFDGSVLQNIPNTTETWTTAIVICLDQLNAYDTAKGLIMNPLRTCFAIFIKGTAGAFNMKCYDNAFTRFHGGNMIHGTSYAYVINASNIQILARSQLYFPKTKYKVLFFN